MKKIVGMALLLVMLWSYPVLADTVTLDPGTTNYASTITGYQTFGDLMVGMKVTAYFGATSETAIWAAGTPGTGSASGASGWSLTETGDTFTGTWTLTTGTNTITRLLIDSAPGNTVFDITDPSTGTPGSEQGKTFYENPNTDLVVDATYRDEVALIPNAAVGDLFRYLDLSFNGGQGFSGTMTYISDTDNAVIPVIPEPATMLLLGSGLIGLAGYARRRFKK